MDDFFFFFLAGVFFLRIIVDHTKFIDYICRCQSNVHFFLIFFRF